MDLFEYQAKELFAKHQVPTTPGRVTTTAADAKVIATEIGRPVMVKAQVKAGGRGKAGGVKYAATPEEAFTYASNILGLDIKGHIVKKLLVAEASDIAEEYYISFLLDRANRTYLAMCSVEGGMEMDEVAATKPERLAKVPVDAVTGVDLAFARSIAEQGHLPDAAAVTIAKLWEVFVKEDATVEVNPWFAPPTIKSWRWTSKFAAYRASRTVFSRILKPRIRESWSTFRRRIPSHPSASACWSEGSTARRSK